MMEKKRTYRPTRIAGGVKLDRRVCKHESHNVSETRDVFRSIILCSLRLRNLPPPSWRICCPTFGRILIALMSWWIIDVSYLFAKLNSRCVCNGYLTNDRKSDALPNFWFHFTMACYVLGKRSPNYQVQFRNNWLHMWKSWDSHNAPCR